MRKVLFFMVIFLLINTSLICVKGDFIGYEVSVRIESYDKTITKCNVVATTFIEALQKVGQKEKIDIVILQNDKERKEIYSIDGIINKRFNNYDSWNGFITRNGQIIEPYNFLDQLLKANDEIVIYYGNIRDTRKVADIYTNEVKNSLTAKIVSEYSTWVEEKGDWQLMNITENMQNVNVHLTLHKNFSQLTKTNKEGMSKFNISKTGYYTIYADGYKPNYYPEIVKTPNKKLLLGIDNDDAVTRAEFTAVIVNLLAMDYVENNTEIIDLNTNDKNYREIITALSNGLVSGYADKTFKLNKNISFLEGCVILSRAFDLPEKTNIQYKDVPNWALDDINKLSSWGIINGIDINWTDNISKSIFENILTNIKNT